MRPFYNKLYSLTKYGAGLLCLGLMACTGIPPIQEMSDARQALKAAREAEADKYVPAALYCAEQHIRLAERELEANPRDYSYARFNALAAKDAAILAREITANLVAARKAIQEAGPPQPAAEALLAQAEDAVRQGEVAQAQALAEQARQTGEEALRQAQWEELHALIARIEAQSSHLKPDELSALHQAKEALARQDAAEAQRLIEKLPEKFRATP